LSAGWRCGGRSRYFSTAGGRSSAPAGSWSVWRLSTSRSAPIRGRRARGLERPRPKDRTAPQVEGAAPMSAILITREGPLAVVTLNRPEKRNALAMPDWQRLGAVLHDAARDDGVRAVILTGAAGHFCAGADIGEFDSARQDAKSGAAYTRAVESVADAILE